MHNTENNVKLWFPVAIYETENLFEINQNKVWEQYLLSHEESIKSNDPKWYGKTITSYQVLDLKHDENFKILLKKVLDHVHFFAKKFNSLGKYRITDSFFNIAYKGSFQEIHAHPNSIFSAVYYVSAPVGSGNIVFFDPKYPDMLPVKDIQDKNVLTFESTTYQAKVGKLLIFRSYLQHCVEPSICDEPRISISFNIA